MTNPWPRHWLADAYALFIAASMGISVAYLWLSVGAPGI